LKPKPTCWNPALAVLAKRVYIGLTFSSHTIRLRVGPTGTRSFLLPEPTQNLDLLRAL